MARGGNHSCNHTSLRSSVVDLIRLQGGECLPVLGGIGTRKGTPDVLACMKGRFLAVECKTGAGKLSPDQERERDRWQRAGALYVECRSPEDLQHALENADLAICRGLL